jgi:signal transduction histidine kinase/DNA-binding response OmpR family regulator/ligand-binding sensor domain-containing protein
VRVFLIAIFIFITDYSYSGDINFQGITVNKGLPHTDVTSVAQDSTGYIYFGTYSGLARYDGFSIKVFRSKQHDFRNVYYNRITSLLLFDKDELWIGSQGGVEVFNTTTQQISTQLTVEDSSKTTRVSNFYLKFRDKEGKVWALDNFKVYLISKLNDTSLNLSMLNNELELFPDINVFNVLPDKNGGVWILSFDNLYYLTSTNFSEARLLKPISLSKNISTDIGGIYLGSMVDKFGNIWVSNSRNLCCFTPIVIGDEIIVNDYEIFSYSSYFKDDPTFQGKIENVNSIFADSEYNIWVSSFSGLIKVEKHSLKKESRLALYAENPAGVSGLTSNKVSQVFQSKSGTLFAGSFGGGVIYFDPNPKPFHTILPFGETALSSFSSSFVRSVVEINNQIWIGTVGSGLAIFDTQTQKYKFINSTMALGKRLNGDNIRSMVVDKDWNVWVATLNGINIININNYNVEYLDVTTPTKNNVALPSNQVQALNIDRFGRVWVGYWNNDIACVTRHSKGVFSINRYAKGMQKNQIKTDYVNTIFSDFDKNELLISTVSGVEKFTFSALGDVVSIVQLESRYDDDKQLLSKYIWPIQKQNDSVYWFGTLGGGFSKVVICNDYLKVLENYSVDNGAPFNDIEGLIIDVNGYLWIAGAGLARFNPTTGEFWNFDTNDGLQGESFKIGASHKGQSGMLYFGGLMGLTYFYPSEIVPDNVKSKPGITGFYLFNQLVEPGMQFDGKILLNKDVAITDKLVLKSNQNELAFNVSSFHYSNPGKNSFEYILEGSGKNWMKLPRGSNTIYFSNLEPGQYRLRVRTWNNDGIKSDYEKILRIEILHPWWNSHWAFLLYFLILGVVILGLIRLVILFSRLKSNLLLKVEEERQKEELHQLKLRFFTNISHELRTPLTLILSPIEKLRSEQLNKLQRTKYLAILEQNAQRLLNLVNELIDFRRAELGKVDLLVGENDLKQFIGQLLVAFQELAGEKNIEINFEYNCTKNKFSFDSVHLEKILFNLLSNAIKNTQTGGTVSIKVHNKSHIDATFSSVFTVEPEVITDEYFFITVLDNGIGISEKSLPEIFNRFFQVNNRVSEKHLGSGIGLAIVKGLVLVHKGYIMVSSERDKGTEFIVALPASLSVYSENEMEREDLSDNELSSQIVFNKITETVDSNWGDIILPKEKKIMIVEDNAEVRNYLSDELSKYFTVIEAANGLEAFEKLNDSLPDLIITDVMMPLSDGIELTQKLKSDSKTMKIPVIMLTARNSQLNEEEGVEAGADLYLRKPFSMKLLELYVRNLLKLDSTIVELDKTDVYKELRAKAQDIKERLFLQKTLDIIEERLDDLSFSVDDLVREVAMGRTMFYKRIKQLTGISAKEIIRTIRLKRSQELLASSDKTISEVKDMVGFGSISHFTQSFKKQFGITPSEFIKNYRK